MAGRIAARSLLRNLLTQGMSPRRLAFTIALGVMIGILPIAWGSTLVCALLAFLLRLNQVGIQAANYLAFPLQIALLVPFYRIGGYFFPWGVSSAPLQFTLRTFREDWSGGILLLASATLKALGAWLILAPPAAGLLYLILMPIVSRIPLGNQNESHEITLISGEVR